MDYFNTVKKHIPQIISNLREDIINDGTIYEFVKNREELEKLLDIQEKLIIKYLMDFQVNSFDEKTCWEFYKDLKIPYTIIYRSLNRLKAEIIKFLNRENIEKEEVFEFTKYFQKFCDLAAKVYLKKDIYALKKLSASPFKKYHMFNAHLNWIDSIVESLQKDDMSVFPLMKAEECVFNDILLYPESLMVCIDKNLCMYLYDLHQLIHKTANSFYLYYLKEKFSEAYMIFRDLKEQIFKFSQVISELYFVTYSDLENSFFRLIELLQLENDMYVSMIDIKGLKSLNTIYGENVITQAKNIFSERIADFCSGDSKRVLFVKGNTNDFYFINLEYTDEEFKKYIEKLAGFITRPVKVQNTEIEMPFVISSLFVEKYSDLKDFEFIKVLNSIKKDVKKKKQNILIINDKNYIDEIVNEKYNEQFIISKLNNNDVDIMFQPIYDCQNGEIYTLEVLGRIKDDKKLIPAGVFIDKIYDMNLIEKFDMLILNKIMEKESLIKSVTDRIFINISFQSLLNSDYMAKLQKLLTELEIGIILELTEQKFVENLELIIDIHKKYGIKFAVDDFGSGYSSLKTVVDLAREGVLKILKIDGTLIKDMENDEYMKKIVKIVSRLGSELELKTVAEYVETEKVMELLRFYRIDLAQGYYLSKPKSIEDLIVQKAGIPAF
jgi:EAL domain-containing protein (putative c-di-GMP-specific phosphodiesterase class I)/GGDEF domain-containing protein